MKALFKSKNLIGDGLYIQPALAAWVAQHPGWEIHLLTLKDHITCLYEGMGIPKLKIVHDEPTEEYDFQHEFDVNKAFSLGDTEKIHISKAYAKLLGVEIEDSPQVFYRPPDGDDAGEGRVLLSMFSNSCACRKGKPPNKMITWAHWLPILALARQLGEVGALGGPDDRAPLPMDEFEYLVGKPLPYIARTMKKAKLLITIDNGMGHLAATQGTPTILFYPACLGMHWIIPSGNGRLFVCQIDPVSVTIADAVLIVRRGIQALLGEK